MRATHRYVCSLIAAGVLGAALVACDREEDEAKGPRQEVGFNELPGSVRATIVAQSTGATLQGIEKLTEGGKAVYEAHLLSRGKQSEVRVGEDGRVLPGRSDEDDDD